mgnify:CR=1 FL=1
MGAGESKPEEEKIPALLNHSTTLQSDTYSLIFNVGAGAGIILIVFIGGLLLARILFPKLFTGLFNNARPRERMEDLYGRIRDRLRNRNDLPPPLPMFHPNVMQHSMMAQNPFQTNFVHALPYHPQVQVQPPPQLRPENRFVELPQDPVAQPLQQAPPARQQGNL